MCIYIPQHLNLPIVIFAEVFNTFKDNDSARSFRKCLGDDIIGILNLYEASFYSKTGETVLEEATIFATNYLKEFYTSNKDNENYNSVVELVGHALETPLHWRVPRLEALWFIGAYGRRKDANPILLELAKLDYNVVQSTHQEDLKRSSRYESN